MHDYRELTKPELSRIGDKDLRVLQDKTKRLAAESQRMAAYYQRQSRGMAREISRRARNITKAGG